MAMSLLLNVYQDVSRACEIYPRQETNRTLNRSGSSCYHRWESDVSWRLLEAMINSIAHARNTGTMVQQTGD